MLLNKTNCVLCFSVAFCIHRLTNHNLHWHTHKIRSNITLSPTHVTNRTNKKRWVEHKNRSNLKWGLPWVCMRIHEAVMSVVSVKYGSHKSSINVSLNVCLRVWLNSFPLNIEVTGYVKSSIWRHHWVIFYWTQNSINLSIKLIFDTYHRPFSCFLCNCCNVTFLTPQRSHKSANADATYHIDGNTSLLNR